MKIFFLYPEIGENKFYPGVASLIAYLSRVGHEVSYWPIISLPGRDEFTARLEMEHPDIVAFSSTIHVFERIATFSKWVKENRDTLTICGGVYPTLSPEAVIDCPGIDALCVGEGEEALTELCSRLESGKDITTVRNIWLKDKKGVHKNPIRPLIDDLDKLPFPDRDITQYENTHDFKATKRGTFMASRGCPYICSYCCNHALMRLYKDAGEYVRYRSVENIISEVKLVISKFPGIEYIAFHDDILPLKKPWFERFCRLYSKQIKLPMEFNCRPELIDRDIVKLLQAADCRRVNLGIESGNDKIRRQIMKRNISREKLVESFSLLNNAGIETKSYNMIGLPGETVRKSLDTVKINAEVAAASKQLSVFYPYSGTDLFTECCSHGLISARTAQSYFDDISVLNLNTMSPLTLQFLFHNFNSLVRIYAFFYAKIKNRFLRILTIGLVDNLLLFLTTRFGLQFVSPFRWMYKATIAPLVHKKA